MNKALYATAGVLLALSLTSCAASTGGPQAAVAAAGDDPTAVESATPEPSATAVTPTDAEPAPTGPGEICDINSMYTVDCEQQYPEIGFLNGAHRATVGLTFTDEELLAFGQEACAQIAAGAAIEAIDIAGVDNSVADHPDGWNDSVLVHAASLTLCL